ncbi:MAG TPA: transcriptional regulator [Ignavibacteria bacterium]|nr:transcriptional regulator [Ignavibacteria bacterium]
MEIITLEKDIKVILVTAESFPDGIMDAYKKLSGMISNPRDRKYFGLSRPENGIIVYKAAAEDTVEGEAGKLNLQTMEIKKGKYICEIINDFMKDLPAIGKTFEKLLTNPDIDPEGYCVEWYLNEKDVRCMVRVV